MSQINLAERANVPIATLQRLLWGRTSTLENIIAVADELGCMVIVVELEPVKKLKLKRKIKKEIVQ